VNGGTLLVIAMVQLALTAAPGVAAALLSVKLGVRSVPVLLGVGLAGSGVAAMLTFWVYYYVPHAGGLCAYAVLFGSIALTVWAWPAVSGHRDLLRKLSVPLGLWVLASLFILFFGYLHGHIEDIQVPQYRFSTQPSLFASDNLIPWFFSDWMFKGGPGSPPIFDPGWLLSDRPPLQIGYVLTQRVFGWDERMTHYEVIGVVLQQFWVIGMWALLIAARVTRRTRSLAMVAALVSDVVLMNGFFVWPKLLGAAFVLAALALVVAPGQSTLRSHPLTVVLIGALAGLAYLSHGTSVFGLVPLAVIALWKGLPSWRWLAAGAAALCVLVLPWIAFQHYEDPPGDRLLKWQLAGNGTQDDPRGTVEMLLDEYGKAGVGGALENKLQNFLTMAGGNAIERPPKKGDPFGDVGEEYAAAFNATAEGNLSEAASKIREVRYWHLLWTLGILIFALPVIAVGRMRGHSRDGPDWRFARFCLVVCGIGVLAWGLLLFGNEVGRTIVIAGSMALPLLAMVGVVAGLRATYPRLVSWFVGANVITVLILYLPKLAPATDNHISPFAAIAAAASLAGFFKLAFSARSTDIACPP
jgi:hypothetical protein